MLALLLILAAPPVPVIPLPHAHAHNDYAHRRPLFDALEHGFCSVEADIFLVSDRLLVGHTWLDTLSGRTLEKLYLQPLWQRARDRKGRIQDGNAPFFLLIEIKTDAKKTYQELHLLLSKYSAILSTMRHGKFERKAVTVVITGNCPRDYIRAQKVRYAGIDGNLRDLDSDAPTHLIPHISASWSSQFRWRGTGKMPKAERDKLRTIVRKAHKRKRLVRFWGTPERPEVWRELRAAGVDLVNTDRLDDLRAFLLEEKP
jgi:hypothetical protein